MVTTQVEKVLRREADKLISRYEAKCRVAALARHRFEQRTGLLATTPTSNRPPAWDCDRHFDPFYVRSRLARIAHGISDAILRRTYQTKPTIISYIPKPTGGTRSIQTFTVTDSAIAYRLNRELTRRNLARLSSHAYAYRDDRNGQDAVAHLQREVARRRRSYVLEFDFANYFGSIDHDYLFSVVRREILISPRELHVLQQLVLAPHSSIADYRHRLFSVPKRGIPQGSSISLFLANVACIELDRTLERTGAVFARYADDIVIICDSYQQAHDCAEIMLSHAEKAGTQVSSSKSLGISLLAEDTGGPPELRTSDSVKFMGYSIGRSSTRISDKTIARMKLQISKIIYRTLLLYTKSYGLLPRRFAKSVDWDLVSCINSLRYYLYGKGLSDSRLRASIRGRQPIVPTKGALSYFPHITSDAVTQLRRLDGWICHAVRAAILYRNKYARVSPGITLTIPQPPSRRGIIDGSWASALVHSEARLPSAVLASRYVQKVARVIGSQRSPALYGGELPDTLLDIEIVDPKEPS